MKKVNLFDSFEAAGQARKMLAAGEFMAAVAAIHEQNRNALAKGESPIVDEDVMDGLIYGLGFIGRDLSNDGFRYLNRETDDREGV